MDHDEAAGLLASAAERARERLDALTRELASVVAAADTATDDEHDPEGTTAFERAQTQSLIDAAVEQLEELDAAGERLRSGRWAVCEQCGAAIDPQRLAARPVARTCIRCARGK
jgi:RNA polymerase-binding transcription factor DksA